MAFTSLLGPFLTIPRRSIVSQTASITNVSGQRKRYLVINTRRLFDFPCNPVVRRLLIPGITPSSPFNTHPFKTAMFVLATYLYSIQTHTERALEDDVITSNFHNRAQGLHVAVNAPHALPFTRHASTVPGRLRDTQRATTAKRCSQHERCITIGTRLPFDFTPSFISQPRSTPSVASFTLSYSFIPESSMFFHAAYPSSTRKLL